MDSGSSFTGSQVVRSVIPNLVSAEGFNSPITQSNDQIVDALACIELYDYTSAITKLTKSLQVNAYNPQSLAYRADCYLGCGDLSSAVEDIRSAMFICTQLIEAMHFNADINDDKALRQQNMLVSSNTGSSGIPRVEVVRPTLSGIWTQYCNMTMSQLSKLQSNLKTRLAALLSTCSAESMDRGHVALGLYLSQEAQHHDMTNPYFWIRRCTQYLHVGEINHALSHLNLVLDHVENQDVLKQVLLHSNFNCTYNIQGTVVIEVHSYGYLDQYPVDDDNHNCTTPMSDTDRMVVLQNDLLGHLKCVDALSRTQQQSSSITNHDTFCLEQYNSVCGNGITITLAVFIEALILRAHILLRTGALDQCKRDVVTLLHLHPVHKDVLSLLTAQRSAANGLALKCISELLVVVNTASAAEGKDTRDIELTLESSMHIASLAISVLYTPRVTQRNEAASYGSKSVLQLLKQDNNTHSASNLKQHIMHFETSFCLSLTGVLGGTALVLQLLQVIARIYYICAEYSRAELIVEQIENIRSQRLEEIMGAAWTVCLSHYEQGLLHAELEAMQQAAANELNIYNVDLAVAWLMRNSQEFEEAEEEGSEEYVAATMDHAEFTRLVTRLEVMVPPLTAEWRDLCRSHHDLIQLRSDIAISSSAQAQAQAAALSKKTWIASKSQYSQSSSLPNIAVPEWSWEYASPQDKDLQVLYLRRLERSARRDSSNALLWLCICDILLRLSEYERGVEDLRRKSGNTSQNPEETRKTVFPNIQRKHGGTITTATTSSKTRPNQGQSTRFSETQNRALRQGGRLGPVAVSYEKPGSGRCSVEWLTKASAVALHAIEIDPAISNKAQARLAQIYLQIGRDLFNAQRYDQAEIELERAIVYAPKSPGLYLFRAKVRKIRGVVAAAIQDLLQCLQLDPNNKDAQKLLRELQFIVKTT